MERNKVSIDVGAGDVCQVSDAMRSKLKEMNAQGYSCTSFEYKSEGMKSSYYTTATMEFTKQEKVNEQTTIYLSECDASILSYEVKKVIGKMKAEGYSCTSSQSQSDEGNEHNRTTAIILFTKE